MSIAEETVTRETAVNSIVAVHAGNDGGIVSAHLIGTDEPVCWGEDEVVLMFVNRDAVAHGIEPLAFPARPERGQPVESVIFDVTPDEYAAIVEGKLPLRDGWTIEREVPIDFNETA